MKLTISIAFACLLMVTGQEVPKNDMVQMSVGDLPKEIMQDVVTIAQAGASLIIPTYCEDPQENDIQLFLFTRSNQKVPIVLDLHGPSPIDSRKPLVVITQGWLQTGQYGNFMEELKDAYLERNDYSVVIVSWKKLSWELYSNAVCKIPKIARIIADYLCRVSYEKRLPLENVHLVGHSLGGQMFGFVGQFTQEMCKKRIGRITGLDPAGPGYIGAPPSERLDETDASFVDVIHTNAHVYGYADPAGHADFYVNCGTLQPGCVIPDLDIKNMWQVPLPVVFCSHERSIQYMIESVNTDKFVAIKCNFCPAGCPPLINIFIRSGKATFGEHCSADTVGKYYLSTNLHSPFASGA